MKVALLLFGQPRGIDKEDVLLSHKKFILDKYDTDVYCHMWYSPSQSNYEVSTHAGSTSTAVIQGSDSIIRTRYNPKEMRVEPPRVFDCETYIRAFESTGEFKCSANFPNYISQIYSVEQVAKLCMESKLQYDMIVVARYDLVIDSFPELDELNPKFFLLYEYPSKLSRSFLYIFT